MDSTDLVAGSMIQCDEDIPPVHTLGDTSPIAIQGPITRARARQLDQHVSSFLCAREYACEDGMLPNDSIAYNVFRSYGEEHKDLRNQHGPGEEQGGRLPQVGGPTQFEIVSLGLQDQSAPNSSPRAHTDSVFDAPHMSGKLTS